MTLVAWLLDFDRFCCFYFTAHSFALGSFGACRNLWNVWTLICVLLGEIVSCSTCDSAYCYTFLCSVVCLSVICPVHALCLDRLTDLDPIWQSVLGIAIP